MKGPVPTFDAVCAAAGLDRGAVDAHVFADASHVLPQGTGAWGAWIGCSDTARLVGGAFSEPVRSSSEAEMRAIANAMSVARKHVPSGAAVMIHSDSRNALTWILKTYPKAKDWPSPGGIACGSTNKQVLASAQASRGVAVFLEVCASRGLVIFTRHVRGHTRGQDVASLINDECDYIARQHHKALRGRSERRR